MVPNSVLNGFRNFNFVMIYTAKVLTVEIGVSMKFDVCHFPAFDVTQ